MQSTKTYHTREETFFQNYLKQELTERERKLYLLFREGFKARIHTKLPAKYLYLYAYDMINLNSIRDREKAVKELIYLQEHCKEREPKLFRSLFGWIGDMYLLMGDFEEACKWYHHTENDTHINFILTYYNQEMELDYMPLEYSLHLLRADGIDREDTKKLEEFLEILLFLNSRLLEDIQRTLLDYLNIRPFIKYPYLLFQEAVYGGKEVYLLEPFKKYTNYKRMYEILEILYQYHHKSSYTSTKIPKRLKRYLAEWNILQILEEEKRRPKKKIILDEEKIQKTMEEQQETVSELTTIMDSKEREEREETSKSHGPIGDLMDIFQTQEEETIPPLKPVEKKIAKLLLRGPVHGEMLKKYLEKGTFVYQVTNDLNEKIYPYLGAPLIEQEEGMWFILEENRDILNDIDLM